MMTKKQKRLRALIKKTGMTQRSFCQEVGISIHILSHYLVDAEKYWHVDVPADVMADIEDKVANLTK